MTVDLRLTKSHTPNTTNTPATAPITIAPKASQTSQGAVIATRPARDAFRHIETSGLPYFTQVMIIATTVATAVISGCSQPEYPSMAEALI